MADQEAMWPILQDLCERNDNSYTRDPSKKIQLLNYLGEKADRRCADALVPYLEDIDEGVRSPRSRRSCATRSPRSRASRCCKLLTNDKEESRRIKKRILDGFADLGWDVKGYSGTVEKMLPDYLPGARLDNHGKLKRKQV